MTLKGILLGDGKNAYFSLRAPANGPCLQKLGSRCRSLLPTQPPIEILSMCAKCSWCCGIDHFSVQVLTPKEGKYITMGDIYDAVLDLRQRHRKGCLRPRGKSEAMVELCGIIPSRSEASRVEKESLWARRSSIARSTSDAS